MNQKHTTYRLKLLALIATVLLALTAVAMLPPIAQPDSYHHFADTRHFWGLNNIGDVISNTAFLLAGLLGLARLKRQSQLETSAMWRFFFQAVLAVGVGSAYYHWQPNNITLVWDRLPMTLAFSALTACVIAERIHFKIGRLLFAPLLLSGLASVCYWWLTEQAGAGDLRPYIVVQYLPMLLVPLILLLFPGKRSCNKSYWLLFISYVLAKLFELHDQSIFLYTHMIISGHTLKHLAAATGLLIFQPLPPAAE